MAISITAYKSNTVSSVSGTTFNSNGTPFAAGDVGRCIVITSGSAIGQMRKIVSYTDTNTVEVDYAWNVSPFSDYINQVSGSAFSEVNPSASDGWTMSTFLDDVDDTTNINKLAGNSVFEQVGTNVITISANAFLYDRNITFYANSTLISLDDQGYCRFGDIDEDGNVFNGIHFIDLGDSYVPGRSWTNSSLGDAGDLHFYNSLITIVDGSAGNGNFWSLFESADSIYRIVGCTFNGILGMRVRGDETVMKDILFTGQDTSPSYQVLSPYGTLGLVLNLNFVDKNQVLYWNKTYGGFTVRNFSFTNINDALMYTISAGVADAVIIGFDSADISALPNVLNVSAVDASSNVYLKNPIITSVVDSDLDTITDSYKRVIWNPSGTTVDDSTVTDGDWDEYAATWWTITLGTTGYRGLNDGTTTTPYVQAIISYAWLPNKLVEPVTTPSNVVFTALPDNSITETNKATVDAYTIISNGERLYDRSKSWTFDNFDDQFPTQGGLLVEAVGEQLNLNAVSLVIDGAAAQAFSVNQTGNGTITIDAGTKLTRTTNGFGTITSTGTITIEDTTDVDDWTLDGNVLINDALDLTNVHITGNLGINTGANSTLNFSNVTVDGNITNDDASHTLTINSTNGSSLTTTDPGTGNGETNIVQTVPIKVTVKDIQSGSLIQGARVLIQADVGGDLPAGDSVTITRVTTTATVSHTGHGLVDGETVFIFGANQQEYNGNHVINYIDVNSYSYTVSGSPTTPATGTITATATIVNELTDVIGEVNETFRYTSDQPVVGVVRKATP